jgi:hypothetical protein
MLVAHYGERGAVAAEDLKATPSLEPIDYGRWNRDRSPNSESSKIMAGPKVPWASFARFGWR